jgi:hypothetical protein
LQAAAQDKFINLGSGGVLRQHDDVTRLPLKEKYSKARVLVMCNSRFAEKSKNLKPRK